MVVLQVFLGGAYGVTAYSDFRVGAGCGGDGGGGGGSIIMIESALRGITYIIVI